jgi:hypothetical protein
MYLSKLCAPLILVCHLCCSGTLAQALCAVPCSDSDPDCSKLGQARLIVHTHHDIPICVHVRAQKQGRPASKFLRLSARSAHLAAWHAGGLLEPLYVLHSARLKLLDAQLAHGAGQPGNPAAGVLEAVAQYRFLPPAGSAMQPGSPQDGRCTSESLPPKLEIV